METEIERLQKDLEKFDRIFLFSRKSSPNVRGEFCKSRALRETTKKILILSCADISDVKCKNCEFRRISGEERDTLEQLYRTYEFSNRFQVISDGLQCGSLMNYVKTGLITMEEFFEALLR